MNDDVPDIAPRPTRAHLGAGALAVVLFLLAATGGSWWSRGLIARNFDALRRVLAEADAGGGPIEGDKVGKLFLAKSGGTALQREAFRRPDLLPLYGSSELAKAVPNKAELFFRDHPSGFGVFPVGHAGTDSLLFLQEIAALGDATAGKRVALSLSPSWFCREPAEDEYRGNFSRFQALGALLNGRLEINFRRELARRLAAHPDSLRADPVLRFLTWRMAGRGPVDRAGYLAAWPLAHLEQAIEAEQDHFELVLYTKRYLHAVATPAPRPGRAPLDWDRLLAAVAVDPLASARDQVEPGGPAPRSYDEAYRESVESGTETRDFDLLLRGLQQLGLKPLVLAVPPQERYYVPRGISKASLELFHAKVRSLSERWGAEVETFQDHSDDPQFLDLGRDHLSNRGWMYYNRALDEFYHAAPDRLTSGHHRGRHKDPAVGWFRGNT